MSTLPNNIVQNVRTINLDGMALIRNQNCFSKVSNMTLKEFQNLPAQLGSSVSFPTPTYLASSSGLVANYQGISQNISTLTVDQAANVSYPLPDFERVFNNLNRGDYWANWIAKSAVIQLGQTIENTLAVNADSLMPQNTIIPSTGEIVWTGNYHTESGPYLFYGSASGGVTQPINNYQALSQMQQNFKDLGCAMTMFNVVMPGVFLPAIVSSGLTQFAMNRNNSLAASWELGSFGNPPMNFFDSSALPLHYAGTVGNNGLTLTVVSTNDPTGNNITQITFDGAGAYGTIAAGDLLQQLDVSGQPRNRFLRKVGQAVSRQSVQIRSKVLSTATSGGRVTVNIYPALKANTSPVNGTNMGISNNLVAGMQFSVMPDHNCGLFMVGNPFYVGMPQLPKTEPFDSYTERDSETGLAMRMYWGYQFAQGAQMMVHDSMWGAFLHPDYCMRMCFPKNI